LRGKRVFHPHGVGFSGLLTPAGELSLGAAAFESEREAIARLSRSLGLPEWAPDPWGLGLRIPDAYGQGRHQDILMVSSARAAIGRHAPLPTRDLGARPLCTLLPYELNGRLILIGARLAGGRGRVAKLGELRQREPAELDFEIEVAGIRGDWQPVARLSLKRRLPAEAVERLDLDPTNTGGGLRLAGWLNRLRGPSYRRSQEGRAAAYGSDRG
jgi:hypothetical protein